MFRRKGEGEDNLFNAPETAQASQAPVESAIVITPQPAAVAASSYTPSASASAASQASQYGARPAVDLRPAAPQSPTSFRPSASTIGSDLTRGRLPEVKTGMAHPAAPADKVVKPTARRVLTVGNDILLKGEIATCDRLVIEGKVDATLNDVHTVEISENGSFKGSAHIEDAEISGLFEGDLVVRNRLVIYATGKVRGKITYGEIEIERGGELTGEIKTVSSQSTANRPATRPATVPQPATPQAPVQAKEAVAA